MTNPLNPTDAALWDIERDPSLRTTIVVVLHLSRPVSRSRLLNDIEATTRIVPKLRHRVVAGPAGLGTPHWELIDDFDVADHVHFVRATTSVTDAEIDQLAADLASQQLDRSGALWTCTYIGSSRGRSALVMQVHHSLTDGVGGVDLLDTLLDTHRQAPPRDLDSITVPKPSANVPAVAFAKSAQRLVELQFDLTRAAGDAARHPIQAMQDVWDGVRSTARLLSPTSTAESALMTARGVQRAVHRCEFELERLQSAAHRQNCTINQVLFAGVVEGCAAYHRAADHQLDDLRVLMPVSIRDTPDEAGGNHWGPVKVTVPAMVADPIERLHTLRSILESSRHEPSLGFSQSLAGVVQLLPSLFSSGLIAGMMQGVDAVITNIPGLTEDRYLGGAKVQRIYPFAPTAGAAFNVAMISHNGTACVGILSDEAAVESPVELRDQIESSLHEVIEAAESSPPPPPPLLPPSPRPPASTHRLSALDTAFLRLETAEAPMHLGGVLVMDGATLRNPDDSIRLDVARRHIDARLNRIPRFRRRLAELPLGIGRPEWVDDEDFDIRRHVRLASVPHPGTQTQLLDLAATLHETAMDRNHPLWQFWFIDGLADGSVAIVEKVHHALVDGLAGVELIAAILDDMPQTDPDLPVRQPAQRSPGLVSRLVGAAAESVSDPFRLASSAVRTIASTPEIAFDYAQQMGAAARDFLQPGSLAPASSINKRIDRERILRQTKLDLTALHTLRKQFDASVNDIVLAVIAGAFGQWLEERGEEPFDVHVAVPVATRRTRGRFDSGNRLGAVLITLPVCEPSSRRRITRIKSVMDRYKAAHDGEGVALALDALDHVPARSLRAARLLSLQRVANLVVTNVPGPPKPVFFLEAEVSDLIPILPLGPNLGLGIAAMSYRDTLTMSVFADPGVCPDIDSFVDALQAEFERTVHLCPK